MMDIGELSELGGGHYTLHDPCNDFALSFHKSRCAKLVLKALAPEGSVPPGREATTAEFYLPFALVRRLTNSLSELLVVADELQRRSDEAARTGLMNFSPIPEKDA